MPPRAREIGTLFAVCVAGAVVVLATATPTPQRRPTRLTLATAEGSTSPPAASATSSGALPGARSASSADTGGPGRIKGCQIEDRGWGRYAPPWRSLGVAGARLMVPQQMPELRYDLLLHFHGGEAVRKLVAPADLGVAVATIDAGQSSSAYGKALSDPQVIDALLTRVDEVFAPAKRRNLIISSWSAGYAAVREILRQQPTLAQAVVVLDGVHASYTDDGSTLRPSDVSPFSALAKRARAEESLLVLTHSEIRPPGYASTKRVADYLLDQLGAQRRYAGLIAVQPGVRLKTHYATGKLRVFGYTGSDRHAHCVQLSLLPELLKTHILPHVAAR